MTVSLLPPPITIDELRTRGTVTLEETAAFLGISRSQAYNLAKRGDLPTIKLGGRVRVSAPLLLEMVTTPRD